MGNLGKPAVELLKTGRFTAALSVLKACPEESQEYDLCLSEALLRVGEWNDAASRIERLISSGSRTSQAGALGLRAELHGYRGAADGAETDFGAAIQLATSIGNRQLACFLRVRMLAFVGDIETGARARLVAEAARDEALALGDERLLIAYHIVAAKFDATQGRVGAAHAHERLAEQHLRKAANPWMSAGLALSRSCTAFIASDLQGALAYAGLAEREARESGDLWSRAAAAANLGFLHLYRGHLEEAESNLLFARELGCNLPILQLGTLDSLAQLFLLRGQADQAAAAIGEVQAIIRANPVLRDSWYELGAISTNVRVYRALTDWPSVVSEAARGLALANVRSDTNAAAFFLCSSAEGFLLSGDRPTALERYGDALSEEPVAASVRVERNRVRALIHSRADEHQQAVQALDVAERLATDLGDAIAAHEIDRTRTYLATALAACAEQKGGTPGETAVEVLARLVDVADRPAVLAVEALRLLAKAGCITTGAVVREPGSVPALLDAHRLDPQSNEMLRGRGGDLVVAAVDETLKLIVTPQKGFHAQYAIAAVREFLALLSRARRSGETVETPWTTTSYQVSSASAFSSPAMADVLKTARQIAPVDVTVLLTGETGVGKEVLAKTIHDASPRGREPFIPFNCSAIPKEMLESQLFGYRRGAFTGALEGFTGVIRSAEPGTLFLDEVADLPFELQPKLLRFLESREVHPLGEPRPVRVNVRVIAATNADLSARIRDGRFREDLYYRLNTIQIEIPPLRERVQEIPQFARTLLAAHCEEFHKGVVRLSDETVRQLVAYHWPGNIRELSNEMRRVAALAEPDSIVPTSLLSKRITERHGANHRAERDVAAPTVVPGQQLVKAMSSLERTMIVNALEVTGGKLDEAARLLGISRKGLFLKRKRYGITEGQAD